MDELRLQARKKFWIAAWNGISHLMDDVSDAWRGPNARSYRFEKDLIMEHVDPLYKGLFVSCLFFATFRITGSRWYAVNVLKEHLPTPSIEKSSKEGWKSYLDREAEKNLSKLMPEHLRQLPFDLFLSLVCGISSSIILSKPSKMQQDLARAPLLPGRSLIHQNICPELIRAYSAIDNNVFADNLEDETLQTFQKVTEACRIRTKFLQEMQHASREKSDDFVPYPGLKLTDSER